jgi:NAD(P)-dependent dehydrogenase (short-subunit alcohol dehydrogenase family)
LDLTVQPPVNNAGIYPGAATADTDEETFDRVYAVNVKAPFFLTAAIAPAMAEAGGGAIINLGSWIARLGIPIGALYSSTKGAAETLTRAWAAEFGPPASESTRSRRESSGSRRPTRRRRTPATS